MWTSQSGPGTPQPACSTITWHPWTTSTGWSISLRSRCWITDRPSSRQRHTYGLWLPERQDCLLRTSSLQFRECSRASPTWPPSTRCCTPLSTSTKANSGCSLRCPHYPQLRCLGRAPSWPRQTRSPWPASPSPGVTGPRSSPWLTSSPPSHPSLRPRHRHSEDQPSAALG